MPELLVSKNNQLFFRVSLSVKGLTIGRSRDNDISLPDPDISRCHAEIMWRDGEYYIIDRSSAGTLVQNSPARESRLCDHDKIDIGNWKLTFRQGSKTGEDSFRETKTRTTNIKRECATKILKLDTLRDQFIVKNPVLIVEGRQKETIPWSSSKERLIIGSESTCDIAMNDEYVSAKHCMIRREADGFMLSDLGSTNGTLVEGRKIQEMPLHFPSSFTVGETKITLKELEEREDIMPPATMESFCGLVGASEVMRRLYAKIEKVAPTPHPVLIQGETGSGKELVARALHQLSDRNLGPYIILNCGAISSNLIESELFGHEKGAYTGAYTRRQGAFEQANGGTLFLDEIGELPIELQPKLLRVLENKTLRRVGGESEMSVDVRVLAATHRSLADRIVEGKFREDLYYRLTVIPLFLPSLKARKEDIPLLANYFVREASMGQPKAFSDQALEKLIGHSWPGNVRELKNTILRSLIFCKGSTVEDQEIELASGGLKPEESSDLGVLEKEKILETLEKSEGNKTKAAALLGIAKSTLFKKLKDYGIPT